MKRLSHILVLLLLTSLVATPPLATGSINLARARTTANQPEASLYYESAARLLFWQPGLYEQAGLKAFPADPRRAIQMLVTARRKSALTSGGQVTLGDAYFASGETEQALSEWESLFNRKQETGNVAPRLAREYHAQAQYAAETQVLRQWLEFDPINADASERLGLLLAASAAPEGLSLLELAAATSPETATRLEGLISALKVPDDDPAYRLALCGQALGRLNEWPLAGQAFSQAVEANPEYAAAWAWLGLARQQNKAANALEALEYANQLDGKSALLRAMLGTYWLRAGQVQKAHAEFDTATRLEPSNPAWWLALAGTASQADLTAALAAYSQAVKLAPQEPENWYALAAFCVENNAYLEEYGLDAALRAFALDPKNPVYMDMLGRAQLGTGQTEAAEVMFKKALAAGTPDTAFVQHLHLGLLYLQTGREAQAKDELQQTVALDPQGPYGKQAKTLLERYFP
jgi:tetratricopeptide (TPR) repeat protein